MVTAAVSTGVGAAWLLAALFLLLLVTVVIVTGDSIEEIDESTSPQDLPVASNPAAPVGQGSQAAPADPFR